MMQGMVGSLLLAIFACTFLLAVTILTLPKTNIHMDKINHDRRTELYESMALDLVKNGARFLEAGSTSQSLAKQKHVRHLYLDLKEVCEKTLLDILKLLPILQLHKEASVSPKCQRGFQALHSTLSRFVVGWNLKSKLSDIFKKVDGKIEPILKPADPAVRAIVLRLEPHYAHPIARIVRRIVSHFFPTDVWYQDPYLYHFSMFHASHHLEPIPATPWEVDVEARVVKAVANQCCELSIVLERVVLTSTGVLLGCWQVLNGTDPAVLRGELRKSLPRAPTKQLYNEVMLHTSFARLLGPPSIVDKEEGHTRSSVSVFHRLVSQLNNALKHHEVTVRELWFVEELDVLALALNGRLNKHVFSLGCQRP